MKTDLFLSCGHCWVFQICWHIECSTCTASSFRIWNSSTGIPSPPLALCILMLPKAHFHHWGRLSYLFLLFFGTLHSDGNIFPFLICLLLFFFSQLFVRPPQTAILPFCISFSWGWSWSLPPVQCHEPLSTVLQALCLSNLIPWIYLSLPLYNRKGFDLGHTWRSGGITLPTKVRLVKSMVFPVVMYGCESWTIKKAECWRIDAFELWCWRIFLRVPWTARRSNHQS